MTEPDNNSLGEIEMGFTRTQAASIVREIDGLWAHSNVLGKKQTKVLWILRASLLAALAPEGTAA